MLPPVNAPTSRIQASGKRRPSIEHLIKNKFMVPLTGQVVSTTTSRKENTVPTKNVVLNGKVVPLKVLKIFPASGTTVGHQYINETQPCSSKDVVPAAIASDNEGNFDIKIL